MGFHDDWKAAKTKFEKATGKEKPSKTILGLIKVHTGISGACKELDKHLDAEDVAKAKKALAEFDKVIKGYKPSAQKAAKSEGKVYKDAIDKLLRKLDKMEVAASNCVVVLADQSGAQSPYNEKYGSLPGSGPWPAVFAAYLKLLKKAGLPLKDLKGAGNFINAVDKYHKQMVKLTERRPAVIAGFEDQSKYDQKLHDDYASTQSRAKALEASIVKLANFYSKKAEEWESTLWKEKAPRGVIKLADAFGLMVHELGQWADGNPALRPLPKPKSPLGYNEKFGSLPDITGKDRAKVWEQLVDAAEKARLPVAEMKDAKQFGKSLASWAVQYERTAKAREDVLAAFARNADPRKPVELFQGHRKQLLALSGVVERFCASCDATASDWWNELPSGLEVRDIPNAMTQFCALVRSNTRSKVPQALESAEVRKASAGKITEEDEGWYD